LQKNSTRLSAHFISFAIFLIGKCAIKYWKHLAYIASLFGFFLCKQHIFDCIFFHEKIFILKKYKKNFLEFYVSIPEYAI